MKKKIFKKTILKTFLKRDYIQYKINDYINPIYKPNSVYSCKVLKPDTRPQNFKFWRGLYNRFDACVNSDEKLTDRLLMIHNQTNSLNDYAKLLEKVILLPLQKLIFFLNFLLI